MANYLQVGQKFIGKLKNQYEDEILVITESMLDDDEHTIMFLHYYGFEEIMENPNKTEVVTNVTLF